MVRRGSLHQQLTWRGDRVRSQTPDPEPSTYISFGGCSTHSPKAPALGGTMKGFGALALRRSLPPTPQGDREEEVHV